MSDMKAQQLTIANVTDFCTVPYAAEKARVSVRTVRRAINDRVLTGRRPLLGSREEGRRSTLLLVTDVEEWIAARERLGK